MNKIALKFRLFSILFFVLNVFFAQKKNPHYWQQHVKYKMDIDVDVENFKYNGLQTLLYTNNSPDALGTVYYHLYFNAFQPNSELHENFMNQPDPDRRFIDNIKKLDDLTPKQIGFIDVESLVQNGVSVQYKVIGTILKVQLNEAILPGEAVELKMKFNTQIPELIRRSGRNNKEGVALSMSQWYPKIAEYDFEGWHTDPYISHEFHGVWGDFDVTIHIDKNYILGGTGYLQNPQEIGHGYENPNMPLKVTNEDKLSWHFLAPKVHDFTWAADPEYTHDIKIGPNNVKLHFLYKETIQNKKEWLMMEDFTVMTMEYYNNLVGRYPYKQYSVIQGGDAGMEYGMCTLITADRNLASLIGVMQHELAHSWFQFVLASNESKHPWMDEGFTTYVTQLAFNDLARSEKKKNPHINSYNSYFKIIDKELQEPLTTHVDRYSREQVASSNAYNKGSLFLVQLGYIIGQENLRITLKKYFEDFKFKHPTPNDILRTAEKVSGLQLNWFLNEWTQTTHTIDYGIDFITDNAITLKRYGRMPMPIELLVTYRDNSTEQFYIPLRMMLGEKKTKATKLENWAWTHKTYSFNTDKEIKSVVIDPLNQMADVDRKNNTVELED